MAFISATLPVASCQDRSVRHRSRSQSGMVKESLSQSFKCVEPGFSLLVLSDRSCGFIFSRIQAGASASRADELCTGRLSPGLRSSRRDRRARLRQRHVVRCARESSTQQITRESLRASRASRIFRCLSARRRPRMHSSRAVADIVSDTKRNPSFSHVAFDQSVSINCRMLVLIGWSRL